MNEIIVAIKDVLSSSMQDELEDNQEDYRSLNHEDSCDLLSTTEVKDNRKRSATHIKNISSTRAASHSDRSGSVRIRREKQIRTGVLRNNKGTNNKVPKHHGTQHHCLVFKKAGMPDKKYMLHSTDNCFGNHTNQKRIKDGLGGPIGSTVESVKQYKKSEKKM